MKRIKERGTTPNEQLSVQVKELLLQVAAPLVDLEKYPGGEDGPGNQSMHQQRGVLHGASANLQCREHFPSVIMTNGLKCGNSFNYSIFYLPFAFHTYTLPFINVNEIIPDQLSRIYNI